MRTETPGAPKNSQQKETWRDALRERATQTKHKKTKEHVRDMREPAGWVSHEEWWQKRKSGEMKPELPGTSFNRPEIAAKIKPEGNSCSVLTRENQLRSRQHMIALNQRRGDLSVEKPRGRAQKIKTETWNFKSAQCLTWIAEGKIQKEIIFPLQYEQDYNQSTKVITHPLLFDLLEHKVYDPLLI
jgi:hypothetical protein